ncbi:MAG TPA: hypothetical protein G4O18_07340 [Dehalococcoidia bacterium]|nr:hypothetical protein [Dehalococcoidia bacterium]
MTEPSDRVGEVIEASTTEFVAECYELYGLPPLGSLVSVGDAADKTFGIVYHATTASVEPGRRPIARGKDEVSEEGIYKSSPQLEKLLRSEFSALVVGHGNSEAIHQFLPPKPARIHGFVYLCPSEQVKTFSRSFDFLNLLITTSLPVSVEELVAATLRQMGQAHEDKQAFLKAAGRELATLLSSDYSRLRAILGRIAPE